jgi:hypothetical protein
VCRGSVVIPTTARLRSQHRHLDHLRAGVDRVIAALRDRAVLRLSYGKKKPVWTLSNNIASIIIDPEIASIVIAHPNCAGCDGTLFQNQTFAQTYRYLEEDYHG